MRAAVQFSADSLGELSSDTKSEAGSLLSSGDRGIEPVELIKNLFLLVDRDARTAVADAENDRCCSWFQVDKKIIPRAGVFKTVVEQIEGDLLQSIPIADNLLLRFDLPQQVEAGFIDPHQLAVEQFV